MYPPIPFCLKTSTHRVILPQKQWTKSHLLKEDKFWQSEFICGWDLFTGNNFGFSFSSSQSLSSLFSIPSCCFCLMLCESSRRFCASSVRSMDANDGCFYKGVSCFPSLEQAVLIWGNGYWFGYWFTELIISAPYEDQQGRRKRKWKRWKAGLEEDEGRCAFWCGWWDKGMS